jgi:hypothetical protein
LERELVKMGEGGGLGKVSVRLGLGGLRACPGPMTIP